MSKNKYTPLSVPHICGNEWKYVKECLDTGWVSSAGKYVEKFEHSVAEYLGVKYAVACVNGTSAIHISLILSNISKDDEVIVPTVTFIAPINAVKYVNATPVFMDCDDYLNIDVEKTTEFIRNECEYTKGHLVNKLTKKKIKAIIPVNVFGNPVDIQPLLVLSKKYNLTIIEDATESLGSFYKQGKYKNKMAGSVSDIGCLSFNGNKIITCGGGGMIVTNNNKIAKKAKYLTTQSKNDEIKYIHNEIGYNYRLTNIQAAIGLAQLEKLSEYIKIKRNNYLHYNNEIKNIHGLSMLGEPTYGFSNFWFYSLLVDEKEYGISNFDLMQCLEKEKIQSRPLWYLNHLQKPFKKCQKYKIEKANKFYNFLLNIPCSVDLEKARIESIVNIIKKNGK